MTKMDHWQRAQRCIAQGALTNSKNPKSHVLGVYPTHVTHGKGCVLVDVERRRYIDFICGLGANLLGYGAQPVTDALQETLYGGWAHSLPTHHELEAAELVKEMFPFIDCVKFLKTGTEACMAAVRIARTQTGRPFILSEGYHGWSDDFVSLTPPAHGVNVGPYTMKLENLSEITSDVAGVIVEPVICDASEERKVWLEALRKRCTEVGALLIFDEVITGFRFKNFSVSKCFDVTPDIICLGKAIANGLPLALVGGSYAVMNSVPYFVSSTFAGEVLSLTAAKAVMRTLMKRGKYDIDHLWDRGQAWINYFNAIDPDVIKLNAFPTRGAFVADPVVKALFFQEAVKAGVLFGPSWFYNWHLSEHDGAVLGMCKDIIGRIKRGEVSLEGDMPQSPFAMKVRGL